MNKNKVENDEANRALIVFYGYAPNEPVGLQIAKTLIETGYEVTLAFPSPDEISFIESEPIANLQYLEIKLAPSSAVPAVIEKLRKWLHFRRGVNRWVQDNHPSVVVAIQFHAFLASVHAKEKARFRFQLASYIWAIPSQPDAGNLDKLILQRALPKLISADAIWASDVLIAQTIQQSAGLDYVPEVCHVSKPRDYMPPPFWPRDQWLRRKLQSEGCPIEAEDGCILLRCGAVGPDGGIEETLHAMRKVSDDIYFVMLGRPNKEYLAHLEALITNLGLARRAFIWPRLSDSDWKRCLRGADVGHLIHLSSMENARMHLLNSALSTVRLHSYMAAGLPIIGYEDPRMDGIYDTVPCFKIVRPMYLVSDLEAVLSDLASDKQLRQNLGGAARRAHETIYNWEHQFGRVLKRSGFR